MELTSTRAIKRDAYTISRFHIDECGYIFDILEPTDRGLSSDTPLDDIKKAKKLGKTALPTGRYEVIWALSPRFKDKTYAKEYGGKFPCIIGTPGFVGALIHPGNTVADTDACLCPGYHTSPGRVSDSQKAFKDFMDFYFVPAMKRGDRVFITIK